MIEAIAKEARAAQVRGGEEKVRQKIAEVSTDENKTSHKVATMFGTNRTYVANVADKIDEIMQNGKLADSTIFHDFEGSTTGSKRRLVSGLGGSGKA